MASFLDLPAIGPFDVSGDHTSLSQRWDKWKKGFQLYVIATGVTAPAQKRAMLLHLAGPQVQDIFETLGATGEDSDYETAMNRLSEYFEPKKNIPYERYKFRQAVQELGETTDSYVTRLKYLAKSCDFGTVTEEIIRDQVIEKCTSVHLRRRLLREPSLTLTSLQEIARAIELSELQALHIETKNTASVNTVSKPTYNNRNIWSRKESFPKRILHITCNKCGRAGHTSQDCTVVQNKMCYACGKTGHFAAVCRSTPRDNKTKGPSAQVNVIAEDKESAPDCEFIFSLCSLQAGTLTIKIGNTDVSVLIDSGATCNVMDLASWHSLHGRENHLKLCNTTKQIYTYGSSTPLQLKGKFYTSVQTHETGPPLQTEFYVVDGTGSPLLGRQTAMALGVLQIGRDVGSARVNMVSPAISALKEEFKDCFSGFGKLKDFQLELHIDPHVKPIAQPVRRLPYSLRSPVEHKLAELLDLDIIEPVEGPTPWVSPLVVVPKGTDIRICVDMRCANQAVQRERHPIPTIEDVLHAMNGASVFSKLDLKWGYHQIELTPASRVITTFASHKGLFRYKRLMFGVSSAPEAYQHVIQQVLHGCEGTHNISDDIIVWGTNTQEHDERLRAVLHRLKEKGLTLNEKKCTFQMNEITFMGHVLSDRGIGPEDCKIKAVSDARNPENPAEVRSFLGLVNYCAKFIPDMATVSEPLRLLTRKAVPWKWGLLEQGAFDELKRRLTCATTLAYFNPTAHTQVIVDASPVGLGAILVQRQCTGDYRPIQYSSRSLTDVERRYSQTEKEALAVVWGCERFHTYLYGLDFEIITDHKPLEVIYSPRSKPSARIERWVLRLLPYRFTVRYRPGPTNAADALSRLPQSSAPVHNLAEEYIRFVATNAMPQALTPREVEELSSVDPEIARLRKCVRQGVWVDCDPSYHRIKQELSIAGQLVLRGNRIVMPKDLRKRTLHLAHEGHQGIVRTKQRLREKVWWPGIDKDVERLVSSCRACQLVGSKPKPEPVTHTVLPEGPWEDLAIDLCDIPSGHHLLVVVDYYSRWQEVVVLTKATSSTVIEGLESIFASHGLPKRIVSDNGAQFTSQEFQDYLKSNAIEHHRTTPYWPQANGEVERQNRTLLKALRIAHLERRDWKKELWRFLLAYRTTPHTVTGVSPAELLCGRKFRTKLPDIGGPPTSQKPFRHIDEERKIRAEQYANHRRHCQPSGLQQGDKVLLQSDRFNKLAPSFEPEPYVVKEKRGTQVVLEDLDGHTKVRNSSFVKKFIESEGQVSEDGEQAKSSDDTASDPDFNPQPSTSEWPREKRATNPPAYLKDYVYSQEFIG